MTSPADSKDSLTAVLPVQTVRADSDSILQQKADSVLIDTVKPVLQKEIIHPGLKGTPVPYHLQSDIGVAAALLFCFFMTAYVLARGKRFLIQQVKDFALTKERASIFTTATVSDFRYRLLLLFQTCILFGICFFDYFHTVTPVLFEQRLPLVVLTIYVVVCTVYLFLKWQIYRFLGWVFFDKAKSGIWLESYSVILYYLGFLLYPVVLLTVYTDVADHIWVPLVLALVIFAKILMFYKWLKVFFSNMYGILYLIVYFCALELIPTLLIYQVLVHINNLLLIKQ